MIKALLVVFICSRVFAMEIEDPHQSANTLQQFFPPVASQPFTCGKPVRYTQTISHCDLVCNKNPCTEMCQKVSPREFLIAAEGCSSNQIQVVSNLGWIVDVNPSQLKYGQTWLEEFLTSLDFFIVPSGTFVIDGLIPMAQTKVWVDESGDEHYLQVATIFLNYLQVKDGPPTNFEMYLDLNARGVEQLLYFGMVGSDEGYFFKRRGFIK
jgi:hypothetical protein